MPPRSGVVSAVLAVVFAVLVGVWLMLSSHLSVPSWGMLLAGLSLLGWAVRFIVRALPAGALPQGGQRRRSHSAQARARVVLVVVITLAAALSGALSAGATHGITLIPAAICLSTLVSDEEVPPVAGVLFSLLLVLVAGIAVLAAGLHSAAPLWSVLAAFGLAFLGGWARRARLQAAAEAIRLRERDAQLRDENRRMSLARDLHDVLAHSLGGLAVQLDAADALLAAGRVDEAQQRVSSSRHLARQGLAEVRRTVALLRDADEAPSTEESAFEREPVRDLAPVVRQLLDTHRSLGGSLIGHAPERAIEVTAEVAAMIERCLQEALSNARRHAPEMPVEVRLSQEEEDSFMLSVTNPLPSASKPVAPGGGFGLTGMRERAASLSPPARLAAGPRDGSFVVEVTVPLS